MAVVVQDGRWSPWSAPLALLVAFGASLAGGVVVAVIGALAGASLDHPPPEVDIIATVLQDGALVASAVLFATSPRLPRHFGLRPTRIKTALRLVVGSYIAFLAFTWTWTVALNLHERERVVDQLGANESTLALIAVSVLTCVVAPVCEEFFFRGFFFTALRNWHGTLPAALITGAVFGAIHAGSAPVGYLVPLAMLGVLLCLLYQATNSLYPCIVLHALNNSIAFGITEHWGWQIPVLAISSLAAIALLLRTVVRASPAG